MKILHVLPYPYHGGVQEYVHNLAIHQSKRHQVTILTTKSDEINKIPGVKYKEHHALVMFFRTPVAPQIYFDLIRGRYNIIHLHIPYPLVSDIGCLLARLMGSKVIVTYHCEIEMEGKEHSILYKILKTVNDRFLLEIALRNAHRIIVTTKSFLASSRILPKFRKKIKIIPIGVNVNRFTPNYQCINKILFVGRIIPEKGIKYLIQSLIYTKCDLEIVGRPVDRAYFNSLQSLIERLNVQDRVKFTGYVTSSEIARFYQECGVFVLPSINRLEAFGISILEAFASGKPVIVTNTPGPSSLVDPTCGKVVPMRNPQAIAAAVTEIFDRGCVSIGKNARRRVEKEYDWKRIYKQIEKAYYKI